MLTRRRILLGGGLIALVAGTSARFAASEAPPARAWGCASRGIALFVAPRKAEYLVGEPVTVDVFIKDVSEVPLTLVDRESDLAETYRVILFDGEGRVAPKTPGAARAESRNTAAGSGDTGPAARPEAPLTPPVPASHTMKHLRPGEERRYPERSIDLADWYEPPPPGTYHVLVMRRSGPSWDDGIAVSNLATVTIKAQ